MSKTTTKQANAGSKKAAVSDVVNEELSKLAVKRTNFDLVAVGVCPHCQGRLSSEVVGKGVGVTRVCETCGHRWYVNAKIRTCKCLTCSVVKQEPQELEAAESRGIANGVQNNGGPFWARTRDLSLIRTAL